MIDTNTQDTIIAEDLADDSQQIVTVAEFESLSRDFQAVKEQLLRSQADYQNVVRRTREEKARFEQYALIEVLEPLLEPWEHLQMAATQLHDKGLELVVQQFAMAFSQLGLETIDPLNKPFDVSRMEAAEGSDPTGEVVTQVVKKGYQLGEVVIRHARVVVGPEETA